MKEVTKFFWERWHRGLSMDLGDEKGTYAMDALMWIDAYKNSLSGSKLKQFDKEWDKLEKALEAWHNASDKKQKKMPLPMGL